MCSFSSGRSVANPGEFLGNIRKGRGVNFLFVLNFTSDAIQYLIFNAPWTFPFVSRKSVLEIILDFYLHSFRSPLESRIMAAGKFASLPRNMPVNHQFPLASSMDLLSSKSPLVDHRADAYQDVSIHGTLPRKKKGPPPIRSCDNFSHMGTLPHSKSPLRNSPLTQDVIQEHPLQDWERETFTFR